MASDPPLRCCCHVRESGATPTRILTKPHCPARAFLIASERRKPRRRSTPSRQCKRSTIRRSSKRRKSSAPSWKRPSPRFETFCGVDRRVSAAAGPRRLGTWDRRSHQISNLGEAQWSRHIHATTQLIGLPVGIFARCAWIMRQSDAQRRHRQCSRDDRGRRRVGNRNRVARSLALRRFMAGIFLTSSVQILWRAWTEYSDDRYKHPLPAK
jgi:hypothetical protein